MSWASSKQLVIGSGVLAVFLAVSALVGAFALHEEPSCMDNTQNQDETGIDCGGSCAYLCAASLTEPAVAFARAVTVGNRTDVIAVVENRNPNAAARNVAYTVELYNASRTLIASGEGTIDLPPGEEVPIYIPNFHPEAISGAQAFLAIDDASLAWYELSGGRTLPRAGEIRVEGTTDAPRITASVVNPGVIPFRNVPVVVIVYDEAGAVMAASRTLLPSIPAESAATATFTWNQPFRATPGRIDIRPTPGI